MSGLWIFPRRITYRFGPNAITFKEKMLQFFAIWYWIPKHSFQPEWAFEGPESCCILL